MDVPSLETATVHGIRFARIPTDRIVEVLDGDWVRLNGAPWDTPYRCKWVNREFDRLESVVYRRGDNDNTGSIHRRILRTTPGGRLVLQDVNTTFLDFVVGTYSPGRIEY